MPAIEMDPSNPDVLYASLSKVSSQDPDRLDGGGLFKSADGGVTWRLLTNGLPKDTSQIYVAIAPSNSRRLYATVSTASGKLGVYRSDDAGGSWSPITNDPRPGGVGGRDLPILRVDPKNQDIIYIASTAAMKSTDGGRTWSAFGGSPGCDEHHGLWINPNSGNIIWLVGDQGVIVTRRWW